MTVLSTEEANRLTPAPTNAAGPDGLVDGKALGQTPKLNDAQRQALARIVESGPIPAVHGVVRWRLIDLAQWVWEAFGISIAKQTPSRELRAMMNSERKRDSPVMMSSVMPSEKYSCSGYSYLGS